MPTDTFDTILNSQAQHFETKDWCMTHRHLLVKEWIDYLLKWMYSTCYVTLSIMLYHAEQAIYHGHSELQHSEASLRRTLSESAALFPSEAKLGAANLILSCGTIEVQLLHSLGLTCGNINIYKKVNESGVEYLQLITLIHTPRLSTILMRTLIYPNWNLDPLTV